MTLPWRSFRSKCKGTNFNVCLWWARLRPSSWWLVERGMQHHFQLSVEETESRHVSHFAEHTCETVRVRFQYRSQKMCHRSALTYPSPSPPAELLFILSWNNSMLLNSKKESSRKTKGQRTEISTGMRPSFAIRDLVYRCEFSSKSFIFTDCACLTIHLHKCVKFKTRSSILSLFPARYPPTCA